MLTFVFSLACLAVAALAVLAAVFGRHANRHTAVAVALVAAVVGGGALIGASVSQVPTRNIGIVTAYGKPTDRTTGAGVKWHAPWQSIDDWDATGQAYARLGDGCVWLSIAAQRKSCIPVQIEWEANPDRAPENWAAYREVEGIDDGRFGAFKARRVNPQIEAALVSVFGSFDPLAGANPTANGDVPAPDLNKQYRQPLIAALNESLGNDIRIRSVAFGAPGYDKETQAQIDAYGQKILESRNLAVDEQNAETRKRIASKSGLTPFEVECLRQAGAYAGLCSGSARGSSVILPAK